ncbi:GNAT family N-acetyltransferase [Fusobacteria bacterium ZRK30]|nr:GNAT family N-acetyltransferase [Fusobacteria bacterium ZRK30]
MNISIRHVNKGDAKDITKIFLEKSNYRNTLAVPYLHDNVWEERVNNVSPNVISLAAVVDKKVVGVIGLHIETNIRRKHCAGIGISISEKYQNNKIGSRLLKEILDLADNWHNIRRIELEVYTDNEKAINLYKKFGFKTEGTLKDYVFGEGKYIDAHIMARLKI